MKTTTPTLQEAFAKVVSVFLKALEDVQANKLTRREAEALRERLNVGRTSEQSTEPLLRRAALIAEIRHPGLTTVATVLAASTKEDRKVISDALRLDREA